MSSSSSVILPALYSIQKLLENQKNKYSSTLIDSVATTTGTIQPSKNNADDFFAHLMQSLIRFNGSCMAVYETYKSKCYAARSYLALFIMLILLVIILVAVYYKLNFKTLKIKLKTCLNKDAPLQIGLLANEVFKVFLVLTISIYLLFIGISVFKKNMKIYQTVYNIPNNPNFNGDIFIEKEIHQITDMFVLDKIPDFNETPSYTSTCPAIPYLACKLKGWNTCTGSITSANVSSIIDNMKTLAQSNTNACTSHFTPQQPSTKCMSCLQNACGQTLSNTSIPELESALYLASRLPDGQIDPYMLYRKLQRYDIAFQVARITDAVSYFNNFLLKENDMIAASSSFEDTMTNGIINLLTVNYSRITNLNINHSCAKLGKTLSTFTSDECHAYCIANSNYVASVFNTQTYQSTVYTPQDFQQMLFINAPNDTSLDVVIKYGTYANIACVLSASNSNSNNSTFNFTNSTNQICAMSNDLSHCFNSNITFGCAPLPSTPSYSNLFINTNMATLPYINIMTIDFGTDPSINAAIPNTFASLKNVFVQNTVNFMQQTDPTMSFNFSDKVISKITSKLTSYYNTSFSTIAVSLSDILDQVNIKINQIKYADIDPLNPLTKYISYSRFISKFSALDQESFLNEFLFNVDEIRHTSSGLNYLYSIYDYSIDSFNCKKSILDATYIIIIIVGICILIRYGIKEVCNIFDLVRENEVEDLKEVFTDNDDELKEISDETINKEAKGYEEGQEPESNTDKEQKQEALNAVVAANNHIGGDPTPEEEKEEIKSICQDINYKKAKKAKFETFINSNKRKITKQAKSKTREIVIDGSFRIMFYLMSIIILFSLFYSWKEKTNVVFNFNMSMLTSNGETIVNNASSIFSALTNDNILNNKLIKYSAKTSTQFNDIDIDGQYHEIQQKAQIQTSSQIIITPSDDYTYLYDDLTGLIEAYNQCNMLLFNLQGNLPFPLLEVSLYIFMIIILMILSLVLVTKLKPKDKLERLQMLLKLKSKLESNMDIADEDLYFCQNELSYEKQDIINAVKGIALILLPIFTVFFSVSLMQNTDDFTSGLYASTLFRDTQCYKI